MPVTTFHQSLVTCRFDQCSDIFITRGIHDLFQINDASRIVRLSRDIKQISHIAQIIKIKLESPPMLTQHVPSPTQIVSTRRSGSPGYDTTIRDPGLRNVRFINSDIFAVVQADATDSEGCWFNTGREQVTKDLRESKRNKHVSK